MAEIIAMTLEGAEKLDNFADDILKSVNTILEECEGFMSKANHYAYIDDFGEEIIEENKVIMDSIKDLTEDMNNLANKMKEKADVIRQIV